MLSGDVGPKRKTSGNKVILMKLTKSGTISAAGQAGYPQSQTPKTGEIQINKTWTSQEHRVNPQVTAQTT